MNKNTRTIIPPPTRHRRLRFRAHSSRVIEKYGMREEAKIRAIHRWESMGRSVRFGVRFMCGVCGITGVKKSAIGIVAIDNEFSGKRFAKCQGDTA